MENDDAVSTLGSLIYEGRCPARARWGSHHLNDDGSVTSAKMPMEAGDWQRDGAREIQDGMEPSDALYPFSFTVTVPESALVSVAS